MKKGPVVPTLLDLFIAALRLVDVRQIPPLAPQINTLQPV
jgi:hypothetical protein